MGTFINLLTQFCQLSNIPTEQPDISKAEGFINRKHLGNSMTWPSHSFPPTIRQ